MKALKNIKILAYNYSYWICSVLIVLFALYLLYINWISAPDFWELMDEDKQQILEIHSQIVRNRGWFTWMVISLSGLAIGIGLTTWGRIIQHKSHLNERYEKAAGMLGNEVMAVRIAGCRALRSLGKEDKSMKEQCVRVLFAFIKDPYVKKEKQDKSFDKMFPDDRPLRFDIQEAANSFSAIYENYANLISLNESIIDDKELELPEYFWKNHRKDKVVLMTANLQYENLKYANLEKADLQKANLINGYLPNAILFEADLQEAFLTGANMRRSYLCEANLGKVNLRLANLQQADLNKANLQEAALNNANLEYANLNQVNLQKADLSYVNLQHANLSNADLQKANLNGANLEKANLTNAKMEKTRNLTKEQLLSAIWRDSKDTESCPPTLPKELMKYKKVLKWLKTPYSPKVGRSIRLSWPAMSHDSNTDLQRAFKSYEDGDYELAFIIWEPRAKIGDAVAQYNLGLLYKFGRHVKQNYIESAKWFLLAAEQGLAEAQEIAGRLYYDGEGLEQDYIRAAKWFHKSAVQGNPEAQYEIAALYNFGEGVPKNKLYAYMWLTVTDINGGLARKDNLDTIAEKLTTAQIEEAKVMARKCIDSGYKDCS